MIAVVPSIAKVMADLTKALKQGRGQPSAPVKTETDNSGNFVISDQSDTELAITTITKAIAATRVFLNKQFTPAVFEDLCSVIAAFKPALSAFQFDIDLALGQMQAILTANENEKKLDKSQEKTDASVTTPILPPEPTDER
jgi:hypothetical protein